MIEITWNNPEAKGFRDRIPERLLDGVPEGRKFDHTVVGPRGGLFRARCTVEMGSDYFDLTYEAEDGPNPTWGCYPGTTRIELKEGRPAAALWREPGRQTQLRDIGATIQIVEADREEELLDLESDLSNIDSNGATRATTVRRLMDARLGQGEFRKALEARWDFCCALTGLGQRELLRASHCKPWWACNDGERLTSSNGFLLAAHVDALFDRKLLTFSDDGYLLWSRNMLPSDIATLGLPTQLRKPLTVDERGYLAAHRELTTL